jgi:hypothetical protein
MCRNQSIISFKVIFFTLIFHNFAFTQSNLMKNYYSSHNYLNYQAFVSDFPYKKYLDSVSFTDFKTIQSDRYFIYKKYNQGDLFIYNLAENFIKLYPVSVKDFDSKTTIGESYLNRNKGFHPSVNIIYQIVGYYLLGKVATKIEHVISKDSFDVNLPLNQQLIKRLETNKVFISQKESGYQKLQNRPLPIILKRGWEKTVELIIKITDWFKRLFKKKPSNVPTIKYKPNFQQIEQKSFLSIKNKTDKGVRIFRLTDGKKSIGHSIWLSRPFLKVKYYADNNVFKKYQSSQKVILATTGGFSNILHQPEGLTIENGNIVNAVLMRDRHGLVLVNEGGINIINLKNESFRLPKSKTIVNPLNSLLAYSELLDWGKTTNATIFQTQLLAYGDKVLINQGKAKKQLRERRLLTLVIDKKTDEVHHIIFNITESYNLAVIAKEVFKIVKSRNKKVVAILNLDVGDYDILKVFDENGIEINMVKGTKPINKATNLIVYKQ